MSSKRGLSKLFDRAKRLSTELFGDDLIEIRSNNCALISGCRKMTDYNSNKVSMSFKNMRVEITGEGLEPESLLNGQMALKGVIKEVRYLDN